MSACTSLPDCRCLRPPSLQQQTAPSPDAPAGHQTACLVCLPAHVSALKRNTVNKAPVAYLPCLQELACSLARSNPGTPLHILAVEGDLSPGVEQRASKLGTFILEDDLRHENFKHDGR